jgi:tripartite ATP-independent transporter DctP family solute receptor
MRRILLPLIGAVFLAAGCSDSDTGSESDSPKTKQWRFAIEEIQGSVQHEYALKFAELVEQKTDGEIQVDVYPYGTLGTSEQLTELVRNGAVEVAFASPGHLGSMIPEVQVFSIHYLFPQDMEIVHRVLSDSETLFGPLADAYTDKGLRLLSLIPEGWMVWTANKPIREPADFDGVKIRTMVSPLLLKAYKAYGANPTPMAYSEVYGALQLNMIDAQVNPVFAIEEMAFHEQQSHMIFGYHLPFIASVIINPGVYDSLTDDQRQAVMEAESELDDFIYDTQTRLNEERLANITEEGGTEIIRLEEEQISAFRELALPVQDQYVEEAGERGRKILEGLKRELEEAGGEGAE